MTPLAAACGRKGKNQTHELITCLHHAASVILSFTTVLPHSITLRDLQAHQDHIYALKAMYTAQFGKNEGMCYAAIRELTV